MRYLSAALFLQAIFLASTATAVEQETPDEEDNGILEIGLGVSSLRFPHYPGSDEFHTVTLPFPYLTYYSERVDLDGSSFRGRLWGSGNWSLDLSTGGSLAVDAEDNEAREGMEDLGWLAEVGPALRYTPAWSRMSPNWQYRVSLPVRQAVEFKEDLDIEGQGWIIAPNIQVQRDFIWPSHRWEFQARASVRYASQEYNQHFHGVGPADALPDRPVYRAEQGISAYTFSTGLSWRRQDWWIGGFIRYSDFSSSVVRDSPLLRDERQAYFGLSAAWIIGERRL